MDVGFIGLGSMGLAMARRPIGAGHRLTAYNRTPSKADPLMREGAVLAASPCELSDCETVVSMLADEKADFTLKDTNLVIDGAERVEAPLPIASLLHSQMVAAFARGYGEFDWAVLSRLSARNAGLPELDGSRPQMSA